MYFFNVAVFDRTRVPQGCSVSTEDHEKDKQIPWLP